jgi:hypothetical protein
MGARGSDGGPQNMTKFFTLRVSPPTIIYTVYGVRVPVRNGWIEEVKETKQSTPAM